MGVTLAEIGNRFYPRTENPAESSNDVKSIPSSGNIFSQEAHMIRIIAKITALGFLNIATLGHVVDKIEPEVDTNFDAPSTINANLVQIDHQKNSTPNETSIRDSEPYTVRIMRRYADNPRHDAHSLAKQFRTKEGELTSIETDTITDPDSMSFLKLWTKSQIIETYTDPESHKERARIRIPQELPIAS